MKSKYHIFLFVGVLFLAVTISNVTNKDSSLFSSALGEAEGGSQPVQSNTFFDASLSSLDLVEVREGPSRDWNVLDPKLSLQGVLIQSIDDGFPYYHYNTYKAWPTASLTKLLTAVIVLEDIGGREKIIVTERAVNAEGSSGGLREGEQYRVEDLVKILLIASSNDAAITFEDHVGGVHEFIRLMNKKAGELGMSRSIFNDASGLSDLNLSTASDILRLIRYVLEEHPNILTWTRMPSFLVQPLNSVDSRIIYNVNPIASRSDFLGGKTGTSQAALQNLVSLFSYKGKRMVMVILGSWNRVKDAEDLLGWIDRAYSL